MSVRFDWDGFDATFAANIVDTLNGVIKQELDKHLTAEITQDGMFDITQLEVVALDLGSTAPDIKLIELDDAGFQVRCLRSPHITRHHTTSHDTT